MAHTVRSTMRSLRASPNRGSSEKTEMRSPLASLPQAAVELSKIPCFPFHLVYLVPTLLRGNEPRDRNELLRSGDVWKEYTHWE